MGTELPIRLRRAEPTEIDELLAIDDDASALFSEAGFVQMDEARCGPEIRALLHEQRGALPDPEQRIAMVRKEPRP